MTMERRRCKKIRKLYLFELLFQAFLQTPLSFSLKNLSLTISSSILCWTKNGKKNWFLSSARDLNKQTFVYCTLAFEWDILPFERDHIKRIKYMYCINIGSSSKKRSEKERERGRFKTYQGSLQRLYCIVTSRTYLCCRNAFWIMKAIMRPITI